ncbi:Uncharacterized conserved protein, DUF305 family [Micromonospora matsumotoense]|uniref:Uncharacterized conserved protein, DUF305 family n=1 Tax=Micromonospora matsumotoense TaxID=121616 RepID=A0A1C5AFR8_9ACTN|nr:DUF305 domain-containing protein [Micromonospora matsumotoense]SCF43911.1 Uncharacterized conserved protein, DUF305 family [Micromonospora matsumotoense]
MTGRRGRTLLAVTVAAVVLLAVVLALRPDGGSTPAAAGRTAAPTPTLPADAPAVIVPGRPGEPAATRPAQDVRDTGAPRYNTLDVWFVRMMIPHHQQALQLAALAPDRAVSAQVKAIAARIRGAQGPEVGLLRGWLDARGLAAEEPGHDHGRMPGMQSPEAVRQLTAARGVAFDRLFVQLMTAHHEGAVTMATQLLSAGVDQQLNEFANAVATEQTVEIARLRELV